MNKDELKQKVISDLIETLNKVNNNHFYLALDDLNNIEKNINKLKGIK